MSGGFLSGWSGRLELVEIGFVVVGGRRSVREVGDLASAGFWGVGCGSVWKFVASCLLSGDMAAEQEDCCFPYVAD